MQMVNSCHMLSDFKLIISKHSGTNDTEVYETCSEFFMPEKDNNAIVYWHSMTLNFRGWVCVRVEGHRILA